MTRSQFIVIALVSVGMLLFSPAILKNMKKQEQEDHYGDPEFHRGKDLRPGHWARGSRQPWERGMHRIRIVLVLLLIFVARDLFGFLQSIFDFILPVSLYYALMLLCLPLLRRFIDPRTCGILWMYPLTICAALTFITYNNGGLRIPDILIYVPPTLFKILLALWLAGAAAYLGWSIYQHISLRTWLDRSALPAGPETVALWERECKLAGWNWSTPVSVTAQLQSPMIVGIRKTKMELYLPDKSYTDREFCQIFRHEVRHILRRDNETKLYWTVIRALLWFDPLVWLASRRAAEDIELSCDEYVLQDADEMTRQYYAQLLLDTAGDSRGFSTCLSAKASTLRHRLKCVVTPPKRMAGSLCLALAVILLLFTCGSVSFVTEKGRAGDYYLFSTMKSTSVAYQQIVRRELFAQEREHPASEVRDGVVQETDRLLSYLEELPIIRLPDRLNWLDDLEDPGPCLKLHFSRPDSNYSVELNGRWMKVTYWFAGAGARRVDRVYRIEQPLDWDLILSTVNLEEA